MSSKDNVEDRVIHSRSDNIKMMINDEEDEVYRNLSRYQIGL